MSPAFYILAALYGLTMLAYVLFRDTRLNGERITPLATRIMRRLG